MPYIVSACTNPTIFVLENMNVTVFGRGTNIERAYTEVSESTLKELEKNSAFREQLDSSYYSIAKSMNDSKAENKTVERDGSSILTADILAEKTEEIDKQAQNSTSSEQAMIDAVRLNSKASRKSKVKAEVISDDSSNS